MRKNFAYYVIKIYHTVCKIICKHTKYGFLSQTNQHKTLIVKMGIFDCEPKYDGHILRELKLMFFMMRLRFRHVKEGLLIAN